MGDDSGKLDLIPPPFRFNGDMSEELAQFKDKPWQGLSEPDLSNDECTFGDWLFSSKELVLRNLRKKKTIRLINLNSSARLLSALIPLSLHTGYQPSQFVYFLDAICQRYLSKGVIDAFCLSEEDIPTIKIDWVEAVN